MSHLPIYFAPLQGFTDSAYRQAHRTVCGGVEAYYAPFLRLEHDEVRKRDLRDIRPLEHMPLVPQLIADSPYEFIRLTQTIANMGYRTIDINMGCPFPMQTGRGRGAALLTHPDRVADIMKEVQQLTEKGLLFSVKMRLGENEPDEWKDVLPILNDTPLTHLTVHPRIARQQYKGTVDMEQFAALYASSAHPIIYNGDIRTPDDIRTLSDSFPLLKGIMIGRGLLARPTLAQEYQTDTTFSDEAVRRRVLAIHDEVLRHYEMTLEGGSQQVLQKILPFWEYPEVLFDRRFIKALRKTHSLMEYKALARELMSTYKIVRTC